jgi:hypothetical protein
VHVQRAYCPWQAGWKKVIVKVIQACDTHTHR